MTDTKSNEKIKPNRYMALVCLFWMAHRNGEWQLIKCAAQNWEAWTNVYQYYHYQCYCCWCWAEAKRQRVAECGQERGREIEAQEMNACKWNSIIINFWSGSSIRRFFFSYALACSFLTETATLAFLASDSDMCTFLQQSSSLNSRRSISVTALQSASFRETTIWLWLT